MMDGGGGGIGWVGPVIGLVVTIGFFGLIAWAVVTLTRRTDGPTASVTAPVTTDPEDVLAARFARGEIDAAEFEQRRSVLRTP
jgi:putative membrane protein